LSGQGSTVVLQAQPVPGTHPQRVQRMSLIFAQTFDSPALQFWRAISLPRQPRTGSQVGVPYVTQSSPTHMLVWHAVRVSVGEPQVEALAQVAV
jgi:hypothetical protein